MKLILMNFDTKRRSSVHRKIGQKVFCPLPGEKPFLYSIYIVWQIS
jgi:hypothetical protein